MEHPQTSDYVPNPEMSNTFFECLKKQATFQVSPKNQIGFAEHHPHKGSWQAMLASLGIQVI